MTQDLQALGEGDTPNLTTSSKLTVAVRHQETHFRPVLENLETALQQADPAEGGALLEEQLGNELLRKSTMPAGPERQGIHQDVRSPAQPVTINPVPPEHEMQGEGASSESAPHQMVRRSSDALELRKEVSATTLKSGEPTGLPAETLHGVASAIRSDLKAASGSVAPQIVQGNEAVRTVSIKASESALRVLHLQLHPADLGSVTIRMRLAGDSLEMELHVEREDTAQLLRHDSEKLSALLRGSGYRPDVISVHVIDGPIQDRMAARPQTDMQMQGQSFPHGGAGQEGRSREQENQYGRTRAEYHQDVEIDQVPDSHSSGGVYL